ncbi:MAG: DUF4358 domain-containing protein [Clostridium argentinense]|uniref:DUF4358 domain-containing protein n=1 Tax=Clostridium butanoliproducens TaxID=2991837 RepID=UPI001D3EE4F2|nr:DUF4358 domain-containing protein [Clostridium butanoliproducens]MBS5822327.1 DUF4358 domain-containing protein [Clostridium argentinense]MDU1348497.1 DUF4358 domain-containing protein [Clostridium argentinense]
MLKLVKKINKNFFITMMVGAITIGALTGCSSKKEEAKNISAVEIGEQIKATVKLDDMKEGDNIKLEKLYDIKADDVENFVLYTASTNLKADEIAVIKAKDSNNVEDIKEKLSKRVEEQGKSFKDYLPEEYFLIEKHVLKNKDNYILLAISKDADKIEASFDEALK